MSALDEKARRLDLWLANASASTTLSVQIDLVRQLAEAAVAGRCT